MATLHMFTDHTENYFIVISLLYFTDNYCKHYIENLTFYAVGDKFPTGIMGSNDGK